MWKCRKCGRSFRNENQSHFCGKAPETVDEYISEQDAGIQEQLQLVRKAIRDELPEAKEKISWAMPTWWNGHNIIHFAAQKTHIGLYPGPETVACFAERLDEYGLRYNKGSIIGHQKAGQDSDQDFIYLPRQYLPECGGGDGYEAAGGEGRTFEAGANRYGCSHPGGDRQ